jgi:hypothetical protein
MNTTRKVRTKFISTFIEIEEKINIQFVNRKIFRISQRKSFAEKQEEIQADG